MGSPPRSAAWISSPKSRFDGQFGRFLTQDSQTQSGTLPSQICPVRRISARFLPIILCYAVKKAFHCIGRGAIMAALELLWPNQKAQAGPGMLIEKLAAGVVRVQTPLGPRYVMPSLLQRVYLLWMFRNFAILPHAVLSGRQQRMIDRMCSESVASFAFADGLDELPVIGTIEHRPPVGSQPLPSRRSDASESSLGAEVRQRP